MASRDELMAQAKRKRLMEQAVAKRDSDLAAPEEGQDTMDTIRGAIESFNQGTTLGFGDEIAGKIRSWLPDSGYDFGDDVSSEEQSSEDAYKMYRDDARNVQDQFAKENKKTALALELAGGIASPVNFMGTGAGAARVAGKGVEGLSKARQALAAKNVLGAGTQAAKGASALKAAGQVGLRGAAEGAIAGAGGADELEDIPMDMLKGGTIGGVLGGTLGGLGRAVSSRKIAQDVMKKGADAADRVPLNMIDDKTGVGGHLASTYRNIVGRVPIARGILLDQQRPMLDAAKEQAHDATYSLAAQGRGLDIGEDRLRDSIKEGLVKSAAKIDNELLGQQAVMRSTQAKKALPEYLPAEVREAVGAETEPYEVMKLLDGFWGSDGKAFNSVKGQKFKADRKLVKMLEDQFPDGIDGIDDMDDLVGEMIDGKLLMEFRNNPAKAANKTAGAPYGSYRQEVKQFDSEIERLLKDAGDGTALKEFRADKGAYGDFKAYEEAVEIADVRDGVFTGKELASTGRKRGSSGRSRGEGKGQVLGRPVRAAEAQAPARKAADKVQADAFKNDRVRARGLEEAKLALASEKADVAEGLAQTRSRRISEDVTFPSQLATAAALAAIPLSGGAVLPAAAALTSGGAQRTLAGQAGWQKLLNEAGDNNDTARLITQLLRQSTSRLPIGD